MTAALLQSFGVAFTAAELAEIETVPSEFRYLLADYEVHPRVQLRLFRAGYKQMSTFAVMADDRAALRAAIKADIIDHEENGLTQPQVATARLSATQLIAAWTAASQRAAEMIRISADAKALRLPTLLARPAIIEFRRRFEQQHGRQSDAIWPSAALLERMMDEVEEGSCTAISLGDVISEEQGSDVQIILQESGSNVRVRKAPKSIPLPNTTEEFRQRIRTLAVAFTIVGYKHAARPWLRTATLETWANYVEYMLGDRVAAYKLDESGLAVRASWSTVLGYEFAVRKLASRFVIYDNLDFAAALNAAMNDLGCKEQFFITPTALLAAGKKQGGGSTSHHENAVSSNRGGKGNGKGSKKTWKDSNKKKDTGSKASKGKGKTKSYRGKRTPDGRLVCDFFNGPRGCNKEGCGFVHVCAWCFGPHSASSGECQH